MLEHSRNLYRNPTSLRSYGVVTVDTAVPVLVCGGGPDERNDVNLFSKSNQNGAPRDTANIVASNPTIFNIQLDQSVGNVALDHPITS